MCRIMECCQGFPVINFGWNLNPKIPNKWIIRTALLQVSFWILLTIADEFRMTDPLDFDSDSQKLFLHWSDGILGVFCAISLLLVGHLIKTQSDLSWRLLLLCSVFNTSLFAYILGYVTHADSISEKLLHVFHENLWEIEVDLMDFPPMKIQSLVILKKIGTTLGFCFSATILIMVLKLLFKIEIRQRKNRIEIDLEDEDWAASEQEHREFLVNGMKALSIAILSLGILHLILVSYIDTLNLHTPTDIVAHIFESLKILLPLASVLLTALIWMFLDNRTETREMALLISSLFLVLTTIIHVVALRLNEVELRKMDIFDDHHFNGTFCVNNCPSLTKLPENCEKICINATDYCNGKIDIKTDEVDGKEENETVRRTFVSSKNETLLYPDELYCSFRLHATFMISYVLSFVSFSFGIAILMRTLPLLKFLSRRRAKEVAKMHERNLQR